MSPLEPEGDRARGVPTDQSIVYRSSVPARPSASSTSPFSVCSDWTIPTTARIWITGVASLHLAPSTTCDEVRRDDGEADERRDRDRADEAGRANPDVGHALAVVAASARTPGRRPAAAARRCRANGIRITVVASAYVPSAAAPRTRPISTLPSVPAGLLEQVLARRRCRRSRRAAAGSPSRT